MTIAIVIPVMVSMTLMIPISFVAAMALVSAMALMAALALMAAMASVAAMALMGVDRRQGQTGPPGGCQHRGRHHEDESAQLGHLAVQTSSSSCADSSPQSRSLRFRASSMSYVATTLREQVADNGGDDPSTCCLALHARSTLYGLYDVALVE